MNGDFSRRTFDPGRHFSRVLMQQGRVLLDADWNEQVAILLRLVRTLIVDFAGPVVAVDDSFQIRPTKDGEGNERDDDFVISRGHLYLDGVLCENDRNTRFSLQDHVVSTDVSRFDGPHLVYIDAWEQHVTHIQDDRIREVALGGPDTTTRARVIWQVKVEPLDIESEHVGEAVEEVTDWSGEVTEEVADAVATDELTAAELSGATEARSHGEGASGCDDVAEHWDELRERWQPRQRGRLRAATVAPAGFGADTPCLTAPDARYRGLANRLYRVEIHRGGALGDATFKWSRDNGSVVFPIVELAGGDASVESLGSGDQRSLAVGAWVEVVDDTNELIGEPGQLALVEHVEAVDGELQLAPAGGSMGRSYDGSSTTHPLLRRWDHRHDVENGGEAAPDGALLVEEDRPIALEDGITVTFSPARGNGAQHTYRTGDYWLIPARTATGDIEWPLDDDGTAASLEPDGVEHHYASLAVVVPGANGLQFDNCLSDFVQSPGN